MKKKIYLVEKTYTAGDKTLECKTALVKESLLESVLSDLFTFTCLVSSFAVNEFFIHSKLLACILVIMFLIMLNSLIDRKRVTKEEFLEKFECMMAEDNKKLTKH